MLDEKHFYFLRCCFLLQTIFDLMNPLNHPKTPMVSQGRFGHVCLYPTKSKSLKSFLNLSFPFTKELCNLFWMIYFANNVSKVNKTRVKKLFFTIFSKTEIVIKSILIQNRFSQISKNSDVITP